MDFKNDDKYKSDERHYYDYGNTISRLINGSDIINSNLKWKLKNKSNSYKVLENKISNMIDEFVEDLSKEQKYQFYTYLEMEKSLYMFEAVGVYINGYEEAVKLMCEVFGSDYKVDKY